MGKYGWKIHNYKAATVLAKNLGIRDKYDYTNAVLHHSLFTNFLKQNGMVTDKKDESTRDVICLDFGFGLRSFEDEIKHLDVMIEKAKNKITDEDELSERLDFINDLRCRAIDNRELFKPMSRDEIRKHFYINGTYIVYKNKDYKSGEITEETIHYKMLYRNPSKAKQGSVMFIRDELYDIAYEWLTMGIKLPDENAKIVEISAYAPLTTSAIENKIHIPVEDILIVKDYDSFYHTVADVIKTEPYEEIVGKKKKIKANRCVVVRETTDVKNTLWDGEALIDSSIFPETCNGMILLRNHFFKACAFKTHIQKFFEDYCKENDLDYESYTITDMYGCQHLAKDIKLITTDNATKFKKFTDLMGDNPYEYWCNKIRADGCMWGIVKTDHPSKLGRVQQMSYQMINSLPCQKEDIEKIAQTSLDYVESLKNDISVFIQFLRRNATAVNHYEMLADLYEHNHDFEKTKLFRYDRSEIISKYIGKLRKGKLIVYGDNLTVCGNPYGLLMYVVGLDPEDDPTLRPEKNVIQVYAPKFDDGEYLCGIRSPQNGQSNLGYYRNVLHPLMKKYFDFSNNILAVNCIHTDVQARMNGEDSKNRVGSMVTQFKKYAVNCGKTKVKLEREKKHE